MKQFCKLHGECAHPTNKCRIIQFVEERGWKFSGNDAGTRKKLSKSSSASRSIAIIPAVNNAFSTGRFMSEGVIAGQRRKVLFDTGADVSLIRSDWIGKHVTLSSTNTGVRSVTGNRIKIRGAVSLETKLGDQLHQVRFLVAEDTPMGYAIIGAD